MQKIKTFAMSLIMTLVMAIPAITASTTIAAASMMLTSSSADAAECTLYETIHPNFPLTGAHLSTGKCGTCASCHAGGTYLGTPKICATCHNGNPSGQISSQTVGRSANHPPIGSATCDACHNTTSFTASWAMNHASVSNISCSTCHNGSYNNYGAVPKDAAHIVTTAECSTCHAPVDKPTHTNSDWYIPINQIHQGITTGCVSCHDGTHAKGKINYAPGHPNTSDACETCHSINNSFKCASLIDDALFKKMVKMNLASLIKASAKRPI